MTRWTPEMLADYERRRVTAIGKTRPELAREWNGNVEPVTITSGGHSTQGPGMGSPARVNPVTPLTQCREGGAAIVKRLGRNPSSAAPSKFRNVKTDGYASKKESTRASVLRLMQEAGQIRNLREQVKYLLIPKQEGERACHYLADFVYEDFGGKQVVEDTKGVKTPDYIIKRKLMLFVHGIRISEV